MTPAYSVKLVGEIIDEMPDATDFLDPFSGTATTGVAAAERGRNCTLFDINSFLVWFGNAKLTSLTEDDGANLRRVLKTVIDNTTNNQATSLWIPPIKSIERWWSQDTLIVLAQLRHSLFEVIGEPKGSGSLSILWIAFSRVAIEFSAAAFNHVSVSFRHEKVSHSKAEVLLAFESIASAFIHSAIKPLSGDAVVRLHDSSQPFQDQLKVDSIVTSPPYPNRISYIRELRPYMYWLGFLGEAREAGELDWQAIGGTWGLATSRLITWTPSHACAISSLETVVDKIRDTRQRNSELLSLYVKKYFHDIDRHIKSIKSLLKPGAKVYYIIGNSTFYGTHVATPDLYEESLLAHGFTEVSSVIIRKRNSKKALYEYCTSATYGLKKGACEPSPSSKARKYVIGSDCEQLRLLETKAKFESRTKWNVRIQKD